MRRAVTVNRVTGWSPMHSGPWAWVPWALYCCERLLRAPTRGGVVALATVLALALLPGWVLLVTLAYQLIVLRVVWDVLTRARAERSRQPPTSSGN